MSVSPVDPSTQPPPRLLEQLHALELTCSSATEAARALLGIWKTQAYHASVALGQLGSTESHDVATNLGMPAQPDISEGERLIAKAQAQEAEFDRLCSSYDAMHREMAIQGRQALKNGIRYTGREREEELRDALRLFKGVLENPIGSRNFAIWFEVGWIQWMLGEPRETTIDSFYHAARLAGSQDTAYYVPAIRHQAYLQAQLGSWGDAWASIQRALSVTGESEPLLWVEAARYALQAGKRSDAQSLLDRALDKSPSSAFALYSDPDLGLLHAACGQTIERFTQAARSSAAYELTRLQTAHETKPYLLKVLGLEIVLPPSTAIPESIEKCGLFEAHTVAAAARREASQIFDQVIALIQGEHTKAEESARRFKIQIDQALSEKTYYEGSLRNIEEHARESGFQLHSYSFNNPFFRRRNQKAEDARFAYESFKQQLAQSEEFLKSHLPAMESAFDKQEQRRFQVEEVLVWVTAKREA